MQNHDFLNGKSPEWLKDSPDFPAPSYTCNDGHHTDIDHAENFLLIEYIMPMAATIRRLMEKVEKLEAEAEEAQILRNES